MSEAIDEQAVAPEQTELSEPAAETAEPGEQVEQPPAFTDEQFEALRNHPGFRDFIAEEASAIAAGRMEALLGEVDPNAGQYQDPNTQGDQGQFDANEYLNPLNENYGQNMLAVQMYLHQQQMQYIEQQFAPHRQAQAEAQQEADDGMMKTAIQDAIQRGGDLDASEQAIDRILYDVRTRIYPQMRAQYGHNDRAAERAIDRAVAAEREYQDSIFTARNTREQNRLGTLAGQRGEPNGAGSGALSRPTFRFGEKVADRYR